MKWLKLTSIAVPPLPPQLPYQLKVGIRAQDYSMDVVISGPAVADVALMALIAMKDDIDLADDGAGADSAWRARGPARTIEVDWPWPRSLRN